jgi:Spy/CpxP family protein refolding chaperone
MNTRTKIMVLVGMLAIVLWSGSVFAEPQDGQDGPPGNAPRAGGPGMPGMRPMQGGPGMMQGPGGQDGIIGAIMHKLDLTDEQREKIETIMDENHAKTRAAQRAVEKARKALEEAVSGGADEQAIRKAATTLGTAIGDEAVLKAKTMKDIKAVLTPDQIKKLDELKTEIKSRPLRPMQDGKGGQRTRPTGPPPSEPQEE